jgi:hypothetical protein
MLRIRLIRETNPAVRTIRADRAGERTFLQCGMATEQR